MGLVGGGMRVDTAAGVCGVGGGVVWGVGFRSLVGMFFHTLVGVIMPSSAAIAWGMF